MRCRTRRPLIKRHACSFASRRIAYSRSRWGVLAELCMLRCSDSNSEHVRMLAALDIIVRRTSVGPFEVVRQRGIANYHRNLLLAIEVWRRRGVWRVANDEG